MVRLFLAAWLVYGLAVALLPVTSVYPAVMQAAGLQVAFVVLVLVGYGAVAAMLPPVPLPLAGSSDLASSRQLVRVALWMSVVGLAALTYDRVAIQGVDYSEGIAAAREEWRELGEDREGQASSVFSMLGYLIGSAYCVAIVLALTQSRALTPAQRLWALLASFALLLANSIISGGRSSVLLVAVVSLAALASRRGLRLADLLPGRWARRSFTAALGLAAAYLLYVFRERAQAGDTDVLEYALDFLPFLGLQVVPSYERTLDGGFLSGLSALLVLAVSYATHSFATVAAIVAAAPEDKTIVFLHLATLLSKLGLIQPPDGEWFLAGRMPSLPGALWHQFGTIGFAVGSVLLGALAAAARRWTARRPQRLLPLGVFALGGATLMLTPLLFAPDFLSFPFAFGSFVQLALLERWLGWRNRSRVGQAAPRAVSQAAAAQAT